MDLDLRRVIGSIQGKRPQEELAPLTTVWGDEVLAASADPGYVPYGDSHPRPQLARGTWQSLNGWWEYAIVASEDAAHAWRGSLPPADMDGRILVPFSPEARLSGVGRQLGPDELLWYRREVVAPDLSGGRRLLLHL
ncbi:MAG: glycoside hydrolase family 2, partial [Olsenella sp.]|nr:glycoside hydrolase family 2 [Olsenella sp.]